MAVEMKLLKQKAQLGDMGAAGAWNFSLDTQNEDQLNENNVFK